MPEEVLEIPVADGGVLRGAWHRPAGPGPFPCLACVHGLSLDSGIFAEAALALEARGVASLRFDLRGHGKSSGELKDQGFHDQLADVAAAFAALAGLPGADPQRRGLLGFSLGGALAALLASGEPQVKALALWSPLLRTASWDAERRAQYGPPSGGLQPLWDGVLVSERLFSESLGLDPFAQALSLPRPLFLAHGAKDRNHPQAAARELAASRAEAGRETASYFPPDSGHQWRREDQRLRRDAMTSAFFASSL